TLQQCHDAIDHLRRIIEKKHVSLNEAKKRRCPREWERVTLKASTTDTHCREEDGEKEASVTDNHCREEDGEKEASVTDNHGREEDGEKEASVTDTHCREEDGEREASVTDNHGREEDGEKEASVTDTHCREEDGEREASVTDNHGREEDGEKEASVTDTHCREEDGEREASVTDNHGREEDGEKEASVTDTHCREEDGEREASVTDNHGREEDGEKEASVTDTHCREEDGEREASVTDNHGREEDGEKEASVTDTHCREEDGEREASVTDNHGREEDGEKEASVTDTHCREEDGEREASVTDNHGREEDGEKEASVTDTHCREEDGEREASVTDNHGREEDGEKEASVTDNHGREEDGEKEASVTDSHCCEEDGEKEASVTDNHCREEDGEKGRELGSFQMCFPLFTCAFNFVSFSGNTTPSLWLKDVIKRNDASFLINTFEGGGGGCDGQSGILAQPTLCHVQGPFSLRAALQWMDMLLAALECYNTFIEERTLEASEVLGTETQSSLWKAVTFFLESIAMHDTMAATKSFGPGITDNRLSPQEEERYNYSKCTIVVRIMEFTTTLLRLYPEGWKLLEKYLCNTNLMKLLVKTLCEPSSIGFNISDVHIMNHLPDVCVNLMKALKKSPYKDILERNLKEKITAQSFEELCGIDLYGPDAYVDRAKLSSFVSACKHLHRAGVLHDVLPSQSIDQHHYIGTKLLSLVYKSIAPGHERQCLPSLDPSCKRLASGLLELAFAFGGLVGKTATCYAILIM
ncbi:PREDICTED: uncharacterized protein LOC106724666, partial [Myotis brandtii]|uniref:uncharacterized protein LOC106724666 n=1 Tax=Myotis brandtii TaxID=109478 RepID=UPI000703DD4D